MANQVFELERKLKQKDQSPGIVRIADRMKQVLEEAGLLVLDPTGEKFSETRTDVEATLTGSNKDNYIITEVLKPAVYQKNGAKLVLLQKAVVLAG
jgi:molecular chaperone GrpE (heat shock protein)